MGLNILVIYGSVRSQRAGIRAARYITNRCIERGHTATLIDPLLEEWFWRPSAIVCYSGGTFGGVRAAVQLRAMLAELGMPSIPSEMPVPRVGSAFDEEGKPSDVAWDKRSGRFLDELEWYATALKEMRARGVPY